MLLSPCRPVCGLLYSHAPHRLLMVLTPIIPIVMCALWSQLYDSPWGFLVAEILTPALRWRHAMLLGGSLLWINDTHFDHDVCLVTLLDTTEAQCSLSICSSPFSLDNLSFVSIVYEYDWAVAGANEKIITEKWLPRIFPSFRAQYKDKWCRFCALMLSLGFFLSLIWHERVKWYCAKISWDHQVQSLTLPSKHSTIQTSGMLTEKCEFLHEAGF